MKLSDELIFISELKKYDVKPKDVTHVVCTHGHSDHIGCNYLFLNAKEHIIGHSIAHRNEYRTLDETNDYEIDDGIRVRKTPGHTLDSVSVIVEKNNLVAGTVAVCGDLFENERDWSDSNIWIEAGTESIEQQRKSRHGIVEIADFVIPGHGSSFLVTEEIRKKLRDELNLSS